MITATPSASPNTDPTPAAPCPPPRGKLPLGMWVRTFLGVTLPLVGLIAAIVLLWGSGCGWVEFGLLGGMYVLTMLGVTVGFHRLLTHRSFATNAVVRFVLAVLGSMAVQASVLKWVAMHRRHHQYSDGPDDPHSPHHSGPGFVGWLRGFWRAHLGWAFEADPAGLERYIPDLHKHTSLRVADALFPLWVALGLIIPAVLGGIISGTWTGALAGFLWGGLVRVFLGHHVTWSVNSVCHLWGSRPYDSGDESRNNAVVGVLALGEGWHNNHHAFPTSARHGLRWWQIDISYYVIQLLVLCRLAWKVRLPAATELASRQRHPEMV